MEVAKLAAEARLETAKADAQAQIEVARALGFSINEQVVDNEDGTNSTAYTIDFTGKSPE